MQWEPPLASTAATPLSQQATSGNGVYPVAAPTQAQATPAPQPTAIAATHQPAQPVSGTSQTSLPDGWQEAYSAEHKRPYYYHRASGDVVWNRPEGAPPNSLAAGNANELADKMAAQKAATAKAAADKAAADKAAAEKAAKEKAVADKSIADKAAAKASPARALDQASPNLHTKLCRGGTRKEQIENADVNKMQLDRFQLNLVLQNIQAQSATAADLPKVTSFFWDLRKQRNQGVEGTTTFTEFWEFLEAKGF